MYMHSTSVMIVIINPYYWQTILRPRKPKGENIGTERRKQAVPAADVTEHICMHMLHYGYKDS